MSPAEAFAEDAVAAIDDASEEEECDDNESEGPQKTLISSKRLEKRRSLRQIVVNLPTSTLIHPRSVFEGFVPPSPLATESEAIQSLLHADPTQKDGDFLEFELENFSCYIHNRNSTIPFEMRALHMHACKAGEQHFYFDGILKVGDTRHYVHKVIFEEIPVGNYGKEHVTVGDQLWIRSKLNERKPVYYQLKKPSIEYARFHNAFLWVADLAKHVVDFCESFIENQRNVSIHHFQNEFARWLKRTHRNNPVFLKWYKQRPSDDFRQSLVAYHLFIRKEVRGMLKASDFDRLQVFKEMGMPFSMYKRIGPDPAKAKKHDPIPFTIVTPYIYKCFSHMGLDRLLRAVEPTIGTEEAIKLSWPKDASAGLRFTKTPLVWKDRIAMLEGIEPGHLISTPPDEQGSGTLWRTVRPDKKWYGLVQKVHLTKKGERRFDVIWLYQPDDTPCCAAKYPWENELFLSNHCTCSQGVAAKVDEDEVLSMHSVEWFGTPDTTAEFFVRQTYTTEERRFVTLEKHHLQCSHDKMPKPKYKVGDTVLVRVPGNRVEKLQPFELLEYMDTNRTVRLRRLRRRREFCSTCPPNELVYTEEDASSPVKDIATRCIVRFYACGESVPAPYNRNGAGNAFYITHRLLEDGTIQPLGERDRPSLRQGFDPLKRNKKLRSLDLFCGCGNFGRGVEDGGAVAAKWANDIKSVAIHTYMANTDPRSCHPFLGSIDDLLHQSMRGQFSDSVPRPGEVDVILGGSPCQGFSTLTREKTTLQQHKNRSLIASFAACVDYWRPPWGILENVITIVKNTMQQRDTEDFFSQLICALIGMGYQAQIILGDAWSHGQPQRRVRVFLTFAAPGVRLPEPPYPSHSTPDYVHTRGLGKMTNGEAYVERNLDQPTAFKFVSASEATADLPDIYDAKTETCISFPDHRSSVPMPSGNLNGGANGERGKNKRTQFLNIPLSPYGVNFAMAYYTPRTPEGHPDMFEHERDAFPNARSLRCQPISNGWGRAHPRQLFHTITTVCLPTDALIGGRYSHWEQPRTLSVMEVRRAQGIPDGEVLLGTPKEQWAMVGNGVARGISMALGLSLREAWLGTLYEDDGEGQSLSEGLVEHADIDLDIPWPAQGEDESNVWLDGATQGDDYDDDDEVALLLSVPATTAASRTATPSPLISESGTRFHSTTPATSLAETHSDETGIHGKRSLSRMLADGLVSSDVFKRPRVAVAEEIIHDRDRWAQPVVADEPVVAQPSLEENDLVLTREEEPGISAGPDDLHPATTGSLSKLKDCMVLHENLNSTEIEEEVDEEEALSVEDEVASIPAEPDDLPISVNGFTVVRMSSEDFMGEY
ncbi:hypothetical protein N0V93_008340 [Gnomoniopsis smithogilvyi]|uniref:DNA (cytosine-5-)-methyltransferase n=1 Tax=Gnomoniopsis smithogilvyi TaxID=1191159 RepID=A0A9W8YLI5_9PEZI|nr:hypothetical protein N0V93_008340 [Gnomoniopsis smithogilvyi]